MKKSVFALALLAASALAQAQVSVSAPWVRAVVPAQKATAAFMQIKAAQDVLLVSARSPAAGVVEIHEMVMDGNVMRMRPIPGMAIGKGQTVELTPAGHHIMLMDLKQPLKVGEAVPITLVFEDLSTKKQFTQEVKAPVHTLASQTPPAPHHH